RVALDADHPLDEVLVLVLGVDEHDDVSAPGLADRHDLGAEVREPNAVYEFVHQDVITDQERGDHRTRRDLERLYHEAADEEREQERDGKRFAVFAYDGLLPRRVTRAGRRATVRLRGEDGALRFGAHRDEEILNDSRRGRKCSQLSAFSIARKASCRSR